MYSTKGVPYCYISWPTLLYYVQFYSVNAISVTDLFSSGHSFFIKCSFSFIFVILTVSLCFLLLQFQTMFSCIFIYTNSSFVLHWSNGTRISCFLNWTDLQTNPYFISSHLFSGCLTLWYIKATAGGNLVQNVERMFSFRFQGDFKMGSWT